MKRSREFQPVPEVIPYFDNNADTMIATKALKEGGVAARMIPRPASVTTSSNLCLTIDSAVEVHAKSALAGAGVALRGVANREARLD
jgi:hypothetical protein